MRAMVFETVGTPLRLAELPEPPEPRGAEMVIRVHACGVCRTDLHVVDGDLEHPKLPLVPGHQITGVVVRAGPEARRFAVGERVGVPWLGGSCGACRACRDGRENLCDGAIYTGYQRDGGFADFVLADSRFCFPIPEAFGDLEAAPLLCAGLIGYRALRLAGEAPAIGFYGFGSAAHLLIQVARHFGRRVFAFTRPGDGEGQAFARSLGADWAGGSDENPPQTLDAAIIFAPDGSLIPAALAATAKGGSVVCAGIHMSDIPSFPYRLLWGERVLRSVANLTRRDGEELLALAAAIPIRTEVTPYPLERAGEALDDLRAGRLRGTAVVVTR